MNSYIPPTGHNFTVQFRHFLLLAAFSFLLLKGSTVHASSAPRLLTAHSTHVVAHAVQRSESPPGNVTASAPYYGKAIIVSLSHQWLYAYLNRKLVFNAAVLTGRPSLPTPQGYFRVYSKLSPTTFASPWPPSSPNWYPAVKVNHALAFRAGGYFLHDSYWHTKYGPGTNLWHRDPVFGWQWGSHGCVSMPDKAATWLYNWAPIGTLVRIVA